MLSDDGRCVEHIVSVSLNNESMPLSANVVFVHSQLLKDLWHRSIYYYYIILLGMRSITARRRLTKIGCWIARSLPDRDRRSQLESQFLLWSHAMGRQVHKSLKTMLELEDRRWKLKEGKRTQAAGLQIVPLDYSRGPGRWTWRKKKEKKAWEYEGWAQTWLRLTGACGRDVGVSYLRGVSHQVSRPWGFNRAIRCHWDPSVTLKE